MSRLTDIDLQYLPELSVRHLPDLSDGSFEMPQADDDYLLTNDGNDFLKDANVSLTPPPSSRELRETMTISQLTPGLSEPSLLHEPLTLDDLTPKPKTRLAASPRPLPSALPALIPGVRAQAHKPNHAANPVAKNVPSDRQVPVDQPVPASVAGGILAPQNSHRYEYLKMKVEELGKDIGEPAQAGSSTSRATTQASEPGFKTNPRLRIRDKAKPNSRPTVVAGGILKSGKSKLPSSNLSRVGQITATCNSPGGSRDSDNAGLFFNESIAGVNVSLTDGVAKRLVDYGQKLMESFGQITAEPPNIRALGGPNSSTSPPFPSQIPVPSSAPGNNDPLTLSQISPRRVGAPSECRDQALAPTFSGEPSRKRPTEDDGLRVRKKRKPDVPAPFSVDPAALQPTVQNAVPPTSKRPLVKTKGTLRQEPTFKGKEKEYVTSSGSSSNTNQPKPKAKSAGRAISNQTPSAAGFQRFAEKPVVNARSTNPMKPGFNFTLDAHVYIETRKAETDEKQTSLRNSHHKPVPDFKALHAVEDALSVCRKEQITPVLPLAHHEFNTDIRAREREKFDEMVKEKELEIEKQKEEKRRQQEIEEEREIRELRKKAIPKANEVPGWYASLPKKKSGGSRR